MIRILNEIFNNLSLLGAASGSTSLGLADLSMGEIEAEGNLTTHAKEGGAADSESGDIGDILPLKNR